MKVKKKMTGSKSWMKEHRSDKYVKKARDKGFRSRSRFKLEEIQERSRLFKRGMTVLDLGSSPGGWSQYAAEMVGPHGYVIACDILPMQPISGVRFLQGDFREKSVFKDLVVFAREKKS
jgi:23S rRNA (uridine2552-2'-O)-methyltransferase